MIGNTLGVSSGCPPLIPLGTLCDTLQTTEVPFCVFQSFKTLVLQLKWEHTAVLNIGPIFLCTGVK